MVVAIASLRPALTGFGACSNHQFGGLFMARDGPGNVPVAGLQRTQAATGFRGPWWRRENDDGPAVARLEAIGDPLACLAAHVLYSVPIINTARFRTWPGHSWARRWVLIPVYQPEVPAVGEQVVEALALFQVPLGGVPRP